MGFMKFESLPNEVLLEIFEYLNALNIFYLFDQLNYRFNELIQNLPLFLNCQHAYKSTFDQFCSRMSSKLDIMQWIYSIQLSNKDTCHQIERFLSIFSLNRFSNLRSLTLIDVDENNAEQLKSMLPFTSQLHSFSVIALKPIENKILAVLSLSNIRTLSIQTLQSLLNHINEDSKITHLTISKCSLDELYQLFNYTSMLKYLNIKLVSKNYFAQKFKTDTDKHNAVHLKQLIIEEFKYQFNDLEMFVKFIPNLKSLSISALYNSDLVDADRWEQIITSSLPSLQIFKFIFGYHSNNKSDPMADKFNQFQTDFWHKQHHWFTECSLDFCLAFIYTTPYLSNTFKLKPQTNRCSHQLKNDSNTFNNVTDLILHHRTVPTNCQYYFSNITSLKLINSLKDRTSMLDLEHIQITKRIVKFFNLKHLDISEYGSTLTPLILLGILENAPHLSSMIINARSLVTLFNDHVLCEYLTKRIKKLDLYGCTGGLFNDYDEIKKFCKIFSNIEQLECNVNQMNDIALILEELSKLSMLKVYLPSLEDREDSYPWFEEEAQRLNFMFNINRHGAQKIEVNIWIGKHMD